jgi:hypothetical protein
MRIRRRREDKRKRGRKAGNRKKRREGEAKWNEKVEKLRRS